MAYQSLYRRYRPRRFAELRGQEHVVRALRNAVRDDRVGHAYLFSGPRGTGKTSTARILAKVLNCTNPQDGEPCCECASCLAVEHGSSFDVFELDAASNRGIDDIRDLIEKAELGTPGRRKVYILDEVHMLTKDASAALLKTLEEPPEHVVFVLATTDPQKVLPTIRSRTQHLDFHLLAARELADHVRHVIADAGLDVPEEAIEAVVRMGAGSARDTLSALDQVAAAGGVVADDEPVDELVEALADADTGRALAAVARAVQSGRDPRTLAEHLVAQLRDAFLSLQAPQLVQLPDRIAARVGDQAHRLGAAATVRAMEVLGTTLVDLRQAPDPRLLLEVALVRLTNAEADTSNAALLSRIEKLERALAGGAAERRPDGRAEGRAEPPRPRSEEPATGPAPSPTHPAAGGRATLGSRVRPLQSVPPLADAPSPAPPAPEAAISPASPPAPAGRAAAGRAPTRDELTLAWADHVLPRLKGLTKALFAACRWVDGTGGPVLVAPTETHRGKCEKQLGEAEAALEAHFGAPVPITLGVEGEPAPAAGRNGPVTTPPADDDAVDLDDVMDAPPEHLDPLSRVVQAFPGSELLDEEV
jgi:DNA polymerase III subunit gamma/tau